MPDSRRYEPPHAARCAQRHRLLEQGLPWLVAASALLTWPALAQPHPSSPALTAADPATPVVLAPPMVVNETAPKPARPVDTPTDLASARAIWLEANRRVAEFPRGHRDLLRWETRQSPAATAPDNQPSETALDLASALRASMQHRPDLFIHAGMNALERTAIQRAYVEHVHALQRAWLAAVSAGESLRLNQAVLDAARSGSELGRRMVTAGNWSQARLMREQLIEASAQQAMAGAAQAQQSALEQLARLMGIWDPMALSSLSRRLPEQLPEPPAAPSPGPGIAPDQIEAAVLRGDPDLATQRLRAQRLRAAVIPERLAAWSAAVDTALSASTATGGAALWSAPRITDIRLLNDASLEAAVDAETELLQAAAERRSMARQAWGEVQAQHASARHAQTVVLQLQKALEQDTQLRYNGMLQSSWDLLASARDRLQALDAAQTARRDFWLAQADWEALLAGARYEGPGAAPSTDSAPNRAAGGH